MPDLFLLHEAASCVPSFMAGATGQKVAGLNSDLAALFYDALPWALFEARWLAEGVHPGHIECVADFFLKGA